ncbi:PglD-related sugar-binding protein, partial [Bacillus sp. SS-TM]
MSIIQQHLFLCRRLKVYILLMKRIALIGQGGHAKVIKDMIYANKHFKIIAFFDDKYQSLDKHEEIYYGPISSIPILMKEVEFKLIIAIGNN